MTQGINMITINKYVRIIGIHDIQQAFDTAGWSLMWSKTTEDHQI